MNHEKVWNMIGSIGFVALCGALGFGGCMLVVGACTNAQRSAVKTVVDVAAEACRFMYGEHKDELPLGMTPEQFCGDVKNVQPFVDHILGAQREQAIMLGTRRAVDAGTD